MHLYAISSGLRHVYNSNQAMHLVGIRQSFLTSCFPLLGTTAQSKFMGVLLLLTLLLSIGRSSCLGRMNNHHQHTLPKVRFGLVTSNGVTKWALRYFALGIKTNNFIRVGTKLLS